MPMMKLFSLNIEGSKHLSRFIPVILQEKPDVVCLQEVFLTDLPMLENAFGMKSHFAPYGRLDPGGPFAQIGGDGVWGLAVFAKNFDSPPLVEYYFGSADVTVMHKPNDAARPLISADIQTHDGKKYRILTTHFTWSPDGEACAEQRRDLVILKQLLATKGDFILCGDMNAPRGKEIFQSLSKGLLDWLPSDIESTLDPELHRFGKELRLAVDVLLSTSTFQASTVRVISGVSDHLAVVGEFE